jgi:hypothetical protein
LMAEMPLFESLATTFATSILCFSIQMYIQFLWIFMDLVKRGSSYRLGLAQWREQVVSTMPSTLRPISRLPHSFRMKRNFHTKTT